MVPGHFFLCDTDDYRESLNIRAHDQNEVLKCDIVRCVSVFNERQFGEKLIKMTFRDRGNVKTVDTSFCSEFSNFKW